MEEWDDNEYAKAWDQWIRFEEKSDMVVKTKWTREDLILIAGRNETTWKRIARSKKTETAWENEFREGQNADLRSAGERNILPNFLNISAFLCKCTTFYRKDSWWCFAESISGQFCVHVFLKTEVWGGRGNNLITLPILLGHVPRAVRYIFRPNLNFQEVPWGLASLEVLNCLF